MIPCKTCLKYPICKFKDDLECADLVNWLMEFDTKTDAFSNRLNGFGKWWGRDPSVITQDTLRMYFKKRKDHHSCAIIRKGY